MRVIATKRLTLEPQMAEHADEMFGVLGDPAIYEYENERPPSAEWLRERFTMLETRRSADGGEAWLNWVVRLGASGLIGGGPKSGSRPGPGGHDRRKSADDRPYRKRTQPGGWDLEGIASERDGSAAGRGSDRGAELPWARRFRSPSWRSP